MRVIVRRDTDIVLACQKGRALAERVGITGDSQVVVVIAISEVARNIINYAGCGEIVLDVIGQNGRQGISIVARDEGPGISDIEKALEGGYSTGGGLGLGLAGARRLMDEFEVKSQPGKGTTIKMAKWGRDGR
ncbi:MAG: ATP-binding protein [Anaerolineae bacterium]|nr:ATP-binding protein [Anaerolineae bacterium]